MLALDPHCFSSRGWGKLGNQHVYMLGRSDLEKRGNEVNTLCNTVLIRSHFQFLPVKRYLIRNLGGKIYIYFNSKKLGTNITYKNVCKISTKLFELKMYVKFGPRFRIKWSFLPVKYR